MKKITSLLVFLGISFIALPLRGEEVVQYPTKPINFIVNVAPGGGGDLTCRALSKIAEGILGHPILIENKAGGAGVIGMSVLAKAKNDGYTVGRFTYSATVMIPHIRKVPFDTRKDFSFICGFGEYTHAFSVKADRPWKTFQEFIEDARRHPGKFTHGSAGPKSEQYIFLKQIFDKEKVKVTHLPLEGDAEQVTATLGGHIDVGLISSVVASHLKAGTLRALAMDSKKRWDICPDIPTFEQLGYKIEKPRWIGVAAPAGVPEQILKKLRKAFSKAAQDPSFVAFLKKLQMEPFYRTAEEFGDVVLRHYEIQGKLLKQLELE